MQTVYNASVQCDLHRRQAEVERCRVANAAERQSKRNRAEWLRRAREHQRRGEYGIAANIRARVAQYDRHPGWKH